MKPQGIISLIVAGLCMVLRVVGQPSASSEFTDRDSNDVLALLAESERNVGERATDFAEEAVYIAKIIHFDRGTEQGYARLISSYEQRGEASQVLRTRLQYGDYLKDKGKFPKMLDNVMQMGNLYLQHQIYAKATEAFKEAEGLSSKYDLGKQYEIDKHLAFAAQNAGNPTLAWEHYAAAATSARKASKWTDLLWIMQQQAALAHEASQFDQAFALNEKFYKLADSLDNEEYRTMAMNNLGHAAKYAGNLGEAISFFEKAQNRNRNPKNDFLEGQLLQSIGILMQIQKNYKEAISKLEKSAESYRKAKAYREEAAVYDFLALIHYQKGEAYEAIVMSTKAIELAKGKDCPEVLQSCYHTRSTVYESLYEYENALEDFKHYLHLEDSLKQVERQQKMEIAQQQFILERIEKELKLFYINEDIKDSENAKLRAEREVAEEKNKSLEKEKELVNVKARKAEAELLLLKRQKELRDRQIDVERKNHEINNLNIESEKQALLLNNEKLKSEQAEQENAKLAIEKQKQALELDNERLRLAEEQARSRNLFLFLGGLGIVLLVIVAILLQLRSKNKRIAKQNLVILENQKVIEREKEKSEALLLNILPAAVAAELKEKGSSQPRHYDAVTVLFTDFVGFTHISERMSPTDLIATLDKVFLEFDLICERNGLSRIKTIGDAYMCVAGLPEPDPHHAQNAVKAALEMVAFIQRFNDTISDPLLKWNARIGLNSGPVVAGVVGIKKFAYDIWGDAVNVASRMESSGEAGKVNISGETHALVKNQFACTYRGKVSAKNKGEVDMYFVAAS